MKLSENKIFPTKLLPGDQVRVVSPARSMGIISTAVRSIAMKRFGEMGLKVTFSKYCEELDSFDSSSIESRLEDIHEAFADPQVKAILTTIGGCNSIQLLKGLNYELIKENPKIFCGYSDITTLQNAIFAKTGLVTYSGPHFSTFGCIKGIDYVIEYFQKCLFEREEQSILSLASSSQWSDDEWYSDQENRSFFQTQVILY
jgi:muramoyltetrapeptide carboxypeptidase